MIETNLNHENRSKSRFLTLLIPTLFWTIISKVHKVHLLKNLFFHENTKLCDSTIYSIIFST